MTSEERVKRAEDSTNTNPTDGQKKSGNYKKGKITIKGCKISIENPKGSIRSGIDSDGNAWENVMQYTYGYFRGTVGKDGDPIDVFLGPDIDTDFYVYVIDQVEEESRAFDEHKVMFGFASEEEAKEAYLSCYHDDWTGFGYISTFSLSKFKKWIKNKDAIKYPTRKLNMTSKIDIKNQGADDRIAIAKLYGEVIENTTLAKLKEEAGDPESFDTLVLEIASPGGSVAEGLEIMVWLDGLSASGKQIITVVVANSYSIASLVMLVADIKVISKHGKVMVHNPMIPEIQYVNANDLELYVESLRDLENMMYELYQTFTGLDKETIKELMDNETYLSPQEAVDLGFSDMVVDIAPKSYEVATNVKKEVNMSKTLNILHRVIGMVNQSKFINQLYSTVEGDVEEIEIFQADPSTYQLGDSTSIKEGEVKLADGSKLIIEDSKIIDINKAVEEETEEVPETEPSAEFNEGAAPKEVAETPVEEIVEESPETEAPTKVIEKTEKTVSTKETVNAQITHVSKWESEVVQDTFELGTKVEYVPFEEGGEPFSVGAGEWELEDGRTVLTDSEGIIRYIKDAPAETPSPEAKVEETEVEAKEAEKEVEAKETEVEAKDLDEKMKEMEAKLEAKLEAKYEAKIKALEEEVEANKTATSKQFEAVNKFEEKAAEAIDVIANNTSSTFKPAARAVVEAKSPQGSIFQQARQKAGLVK